MLNLETINELIKESIKDKNQIKLQVYRRIKNKIEVLSKKKGSDKITNENIISAIKKEQKELKEEIKYTSPLNNTRYMSLCAQLTYVEFLLPRVMPVKEAFKLIEESVRETSATGLESMGDVMKYIKEKNVPVDMKMVSKEVKKRLTNMVSVD